MATKVEPRRCFRSGVTGHLFALNYQKQIDDPTQLQGSTQWLRHFAFSMLRLPKEQRE